MQRSYTSNELSIQNLNEDSLCICLILLAFRFKTIPEPAAGGSRSAGITNGGGRFAQRGGPRTDPGRSYLLDDYMLNDLHGDAPAANGVDEGYEDDVLIDEPFDVDTRAVGG